uniref:Flavin-containing monooxygenase n=1 Tax=Arion vulgaris TaxID=1028688 RepID=A0A0B6ZFD7_9EUPU
MPAKTACVVGAGASGVATLKEFVRQGFKTTCYEIDSDVGGIWHRKDTTHPINTPSIWDNLITNSSKFNSCYSDLPPNAKDTPYLTAEAMYQYFKRAIKHFGVEKNIQFNTRVMKIRKTADHEQTGRWEVYTTKRGDAIAGNDLAGRPIDEALLSKCHKEVFDVVIVCTGYFKIPVYPDIPGLDKFSGKVQHVFNYTGPKPHEGKTVLIVGNKLSAADIGSDVANYAKQVYIAVGGGMWIIPRCFSSARTLDLMFSRSIIHSSTGVNKINEILMDEAERKLDHESAGIRPSKPPVFDRYGLSDDLPVKMLSGRVQPYGRVTRVNDNQVHFQDGKVISGIDAIILCTGFNPDLSFLDMKIVQESGKMEMFKMMFPLNVKHNTLAIIGHVGGDAPLALLYELQARLAALVMSGKHQLPSRSKMQKDVDKWNDHAYARKGSFRSYFVSADLLTESIAEEIGCYPTFWKVLLRDPLLAYRNWYGPIFAAQYRLLGPDSQWNESAKTCHILYEEGHSSIRHMEKNKFNPKGVSGNYTSTITILAIISFLIAAVGIFFRN